MHLCMQQCSMQLLGAMQWDMESGTFATTRSALGGWSAQESHATNIFLVSWGPADFI